MSNKKASVACIDMMPSATLSVRIAIDLASGTLDVKKTKEAWARGVYIEEREQECGKLLSTSVRVSSKVDYLPPRAKNVERILGGVTKNFQQGWCIGEGHYANEHASLSNLIRKNNGPNKLSIKDYLDNSVSMMFDKHDPLFDNRDVRALLRFEHDAIINHTINEKMKTLTSESVANIIAIRDMLKTDIFDKLKYTSRKKINDGGVPQGEKLQGVALSATYIEAQRAKYVSSVLGSFRDVHHVLQFILSSKVGTSKLGLDVFLRDPFSEERIAEAAEELIKIFYQITGLPDNAIPNEQFVVIRHSDHHYMITTEDVFDFMNPESFAAISHEPRIWYKGEFHDIHEDFYGCPQIAKIVGECGATCSGLEVTSVKVELFDTNEIVELDEDNVLRFKGIRQLESIMDNLVEVSNSTFIPRNGHEDNYNEMFRLIAGENNLIEYTVCSETIEKHPPVFVYLESKGVPKRVRSIMVGGAKLCAQTLSKKLIGDSDKRIKYQFTQLSNGDCTDSNTIFPDDLKSSFSGLVEIQSVQKEENNTTIWTVLPITSSSIVAEAYYNSVGSVDEKRKKKTNIESSHNTVSKRCSDLYYYSPSFRSIGANGLNIFYAMFGRFLKPALFDMYREINDIKFNTNKREMFTEIETLLMTNLSDASKFTASVCKEIATECRIYKIHRNKVSHKNRHIMSTVGSVYMSNHIKLAEVLEKGNKEISRAAAETRKALKNCQDCSVKRICSKGPFRNEWEYGIQKLHGITVRDTPTEVTIGCEWKPITEGDANKVFKSIELEDKKYKNIDLALMMLYGHWFKLMSHGGANTSPISRAVLTLPYNMSAFKYDSHGVEELTVEGLSTKSFSSKGEKRKNVFLFYPLLNGKMVAFCVNDIFMSFEFDLFNDGELLDKLMGLLCSNKNLKQKREYIQSRLVENGLFGAGLDRIKEAYSWCKDIVSLISSKEQDRMRKLIYLGSAPFLSDNDDEKNVLAKGVPTQRYDDINVYSTARDIAKDFQIINLEKCPGWGHPTKELFGPNYVYEIAKIVNTFVLSTFGFLRHGSQKSNTVYDFSNINESSKHVVEEASEKKGKNIVTKINGILRTLLKESSDNIYFVHSDGLKEYDEDKGTIKLKLTNTIEFSHSASAAIPIAWGIPIVSIVPRLEYDRAYFEIPQSAFDKTTKLKEIDGSIKSGSNKVCFSVVNHYMSTINSQHNVRFSSAAFDTHSVYSSNRRTFEELLITILLSFNK